MTSLPKPALFCSHSVFYFGRCFFFVFFFHGVQHLHVKKIAGFFFFLSQYLSTPNYICGGRWLHGILTLLKSSNTIAPDAAQHVSFERSRPIPLEQLGDSVLTGLVLKFSIEVRSEVETKGSCSCKPCPRCG